jgi:hypothetical protein
MSDSDFSPGVREQIMTDAIGRAVRCVAGCGRPATDAHHVAGRDHVDHPMFDTPHAGAATCNWCNCAEAHIPIDTKGETAFDFVDVGLRFRGADSVRYLDFLYAIRSVLDRVPPDVARMIFFSIKDKVDWRMKLEKIIAPGGDVVWEWVVPQPAVGP